jgi:protein-L-isoaspartate(D-aspartate) O-methyltransferase
MDVTEDLARLRETLAESVTRDASPPVAEALRTVPRHLFLPGVPPEAVYSDEAVVTKRDADGLPISSSSQPALMAAMLDRLALAPGQRILEIGAGTGYNAALISHIVGPAGTVVSIDIDQDIVETAREHLAAAGYPDVIVLCRDGAEGAAEYAPFDRLIATVGLSDLSPAWLDQLAPGARMVVPIEVRGPMLYVAFDRDGGHWASRAVEPCGFIKVRGALAGPSYDIPLTNEITLHLTEHRDLDPPELTRALHDPIPVTVATGTAAGTPRTMWGLHPWLAAGDTRTCEVAGRVSFPALAHAPIGQGDFGESYGLVDGGSIALLTVLAEEVAVAGYGADGASLAEALAEAVRAWDTAGRPGAAGLRMDAYPAGADVPADTDKVIDRPCTRFVLYRA